MAKSTSTKKVFFNSIFYSASGVLRKCFAFFLLPIYTAFLTTKDYGINSVSSTFISIMLFIVSFSLFSAVLRYYVDLKDDPEKLKRFYGTVISFVFISSAVICLLLFAFRNLLVKYVFGGTDFFPIIFVCLLSIVFYAQTTIYENILSSQQKAFKLSVISFISFLSTTLLTILFVVVFKLGALGTLLAALVVYIVYSVYFITEMIIKHEIVFCLDFSMLKNALKYSVPLMPHNLSTMIALLISKVFIGDAASIASLGVYALATQFGDLSDTLQAYVDKAYAPWLFERLHANEAGIKETVRNISRAIMSALSFAFAGIALFSQDYIFLFVNKSYHGAWKYVPLIVIVFTIKTAYYFYIDVLLYYKKAAKYAFTATLTSSILNVFLSYLFIVKYGFGVYGSIAADAISIVIRVAIFVFISKRFDDVGLKIRDFIFNTCYTIVFIAIGLLPSFTFGLTRFSILNFLYKGAVMLLYALLIFLLNRRYLLQVLKPLIARFKSRRADG